MVIGFRLRLDCSMKGRDVAACIPHTSLATLRSHSPGFSHTYTLTSLTQQSLPSGFSISHSILLFRVVLILSLRTVVGQLLDGGSHCTGETAAGRHAIERPVTSLFSLICSLSAIQYFSQRCIRNTSSFIAIPRQTGTDQSVHE